nr:response regulator [Butyrivibrio sp. MC2013]
MAYKCLLVDDEEDVIRAILGKLDWEALGYETPGYAANGLEALEIAEADTPDVVMTDIRMPYMGGLELAHELRNLYPGIRIIIFSGFDEFEYAKEAIRLEAEEYILKPVDSEELRSVFFRIKESLDKEREEKQSIQKLSRYYAESLPLLQENFYYSLLEGRIPSDKIREEMLNYQIDLTGPKYTVVILHTSSRKAPEGLNPVLLELSVRKLAKERLEKELDARIFSRQGDTAMIVQLSEDAASQILELTDICDRFCRMAASVCQAVVTAGIGRVCSDISDISDSAESADEAVSYRAVYGSGRAINISEIVPGKEIGDDPEDSSRELGEILRSIRAGKDIDLAAMSSDFVRCFASGSTSIQNYEFFVYDTMSRLYRFAAENGMNIEAVFGNAGPAHMEFMDAAEFSDYLYDILRRMQEEISENRSGSNRSFVSKARQYVEENYSDENITIEKICRSLGVSSAYFSTVFKKETGKTFVTYLTDVRMDKAAELLTLSDDKTYIIAGKVGYSDPNYFSYVFKRQFGMSPSAYRNSK